MPPLLHVNATLPQPLVVDVPDGVLSTTLSIFNTLAAILLPVILAVYGWRIEQRNKQQEEQLRQQHEAQQQQLRLHNEQKEKDLCLQAHVAMLANTEAITVISEFKQQCRELGDPYKNVDPGALYRCRQPITTDNGSITREDFKQLGRARKQLQGIWDNIRDDYQASRMPGAITDERSSKMLKRGINYLTAAEPLEAANYAHMQDCGYAGENALYLLSWDPTGSNTPIFCDKICPSRFRWLEDQKTILAIGHKLWKQVQLPPRSDSAVKVNAFVVDTQVWNALVASDPNSDAGDWKAALWRHWKAVHRAYTARIPPPAPAAAQSEASEQQLMLQLIRLLQRAVEPGAQQQQPAADAGAAGVGAGPTAAPAAVHDAGA